MSTDIDEMMIDELREGFAPVGYERTTRSFRSPSRTPFIAGVAVIAAVAASVVVVGGDGARSPALAWSPNPTAATAADEEAARAACTSPDLASPGNGVVEVSGFISASPGDTGASALPSEMPTELPPLVSLDLRGTGGLAVFADDEWTFTCMLLMAGDRFETGPIMVSPTNDLPPSDSLAVVAGSQMTWADGRSLAMVSGTAPSGAAKVELSLPGQPVAQADVVDGRFSIWWFGSFDPSTGSIRALDADGAEVSTVAPLMQK